MTDIVADTDAVAFLFRGDSREQFYLQYVLNHRCIISFMTVAELEFDVLRANWGEARRKSLTDFVRQHFVVSNQTTDLCSVWAKLRAEAEKKGRHIRQCVNPPGLRFFTLTSRGLTPSALDMSALRA